MLFGHSHLLLEQPVERQWALDWKLCSTMHADCYRVPDVTTKQMLLVWVTRTALNEHQRAALHRHIQSLRDCPIVPILSYGFDTASRAFVTMKPDSCAALDTDAANVTTLRSRYLECVSLVELCHAAKKPLGNITLGSFVYGKVDVCELVGALGGFALSDNAEVPLEVRSCMPVNLPNVEQPRKVDDVHALAAMGLRLFGAQFPPSGIESQATESYLTRLMPDAPPWVTEVLAPIIKYPERISLRDAGDLLAAISEVERTSEIAAQRSEDPEQKRIVAARAKWVGALEIARRVKQRDAVKRGAPWQRFVRGPTYKALAVVVVLWTILYTDIITLPRFAAVSQFFKGATALTPQTQASQKQGLKPLRDDASFDQLVDTLSAAAGSKDEVGVWQKILSSPMSQRNAQAARVVTAAVSRGDEGGLREPQIVAKLFAPQVSTEARIQQLQAYEAVAPDVAARLAAAFALDNPDSQESYRDCLIRAVQRMVVSQTPSEVAKRSTAALIAALDFRKELAIAGASTPSSELSHEDLWWLLAVHARKRSNSIPNVASAVLARGLASWPNQAYLELIRRAEIGPATPYEALIHSAHSGPNSEDVSRYSAWMAPQSELALYVTLLSTREPKLVRMALDGLQTKPLLDELVVAVLAFLSSHAEDVDIAYAAVVGTLGLRSGIAQETLSKGLASARDLPLAGDLAGILLRSNDTRVVQAALSLFGTKVNPVLLLPLLEHNDPAIRMQTIPLVKELPLASSRETLQRLFAVEKDQQVRAVYEREIVIPGR